MSKKFHPDEAVFEEKLSQYTDSQESESEIAIPVSPPQPEGPRPPLARRDANAYSLYSSDHNRQPPPSSSSTTPTPS